MYDIKVLIRRVTLKALGAFLMASLLIFLSRFFPPELAVQLQTKAFDLIVAMTAGGGLLGVLDDLDKFFDFKAKAKSKE